MLLPIQNSRKDTPANKALRQAVNRWIRDARQFARPLRWKYLNDAFFKIGADGNFALHEDEGDSYRYEKGAYATIPIQWKESSEKPSPSVNARANSPVCPRTGLSTLFGCPRIMVWESPRPGSRMLSFSTKVMP